MVNQVLSRADADQEYQRGVSRWRACMAERGLDYSDPGAAGDALLEQYRKGELTLEALRLLEIEVALVDATCYQAADLGLLRDQAQDRAERAAEVESRDSLEEMAALNDFAVQRARPRGAPALATP